MKIELSPDAERVLEKQLASGQYLSAAEVMDEALALLVLRDAGFGAKLRALVAEGEADLAAGRYVDVDEGYFDRLRDRIRERSRSRGQSPD